MWSKIKTYFQETNASLRTFKRVWILIGESSHKRAKTLIFWLILAVVLNTLQPFITQYILNGLFLKNMELIIIAVILFTLSSVAEVICNCRRRTLREQLFGLNRSALTDKLTALFFDKSVGQHLQEGTGLSEASIRKGKENAMRIEEALLFQSLGDFFEIGLAFTALWLLSPRSGAIITLLVIVYVIWGIRLNQIVIRQSEPIEKKWRQLDTYTNERMRRVKHVKTHGKENEELSVIHDQFQTVLKDDYDLWSWFVRQMSKKEFMTSCVVIVVISLGCSDIFWGEKEIGFFYPLLAWSTRVMGHLRQIGETERLLNWMEPSIRLMMNHLDQPPQVRDATNAVNLAEVFGKIAFDHVSYEYNHGASERVEVLRDIHFVIETGERVALVGHSGVGKTTLIQLMMRYMDPTQGSIIIDDRYRLREDVRLKSWLRQIGYIPQDIDLLDGTICYNLLYGANGHSGKISKQDLEKIARDCQILEFGQRLTNGLDTVIGENGLQLSVGQRQRLAWGIAFLKDPRIVIIDEGTSNIDARTEKFLLEKLEELCSRRTTIIIAHRLATLRRCNKFIVLRNVGDVKPEESQIETIATSFRECQKKSKIFAELLRDQEII